LLPWTSSLYFGGRVANSAIPFWNGSSILNFVSFGTPSKTLPRKLYHHFESLFLNHPCTHVETNYSKTFKKVFSSPLLLATCHFDQVQILKIASIIWLIFQIIASFRKLKQSRQQLKSIHQIYSFVDRDQIRFKISNDSREKCHDVTCLLFPCFMWNWFDFSRKHSENQLNHIVIVISVGTSINSTGINAEFFKLWWQWQELFCISQMRLSLKNLSNDKKKIVVLF
jgi:hypothetical protein